MTIDTIEKNINFLLINLDLELTKVNNLKKSAHTVGDLKQYVLDELYFLAQIKAYKQVIDMINE